MTNATTRFVLGLALVGASAGAASAQAFPAETEWSPLHCGDLLMHDQLRDEPGAEGPRDVVGDQERPAGLRSVDADYLYLRLRVNADPTQGSGFMPMAWGFAFDLDGDLGAYELLAVLDGVGSQVALHGNEEVTDPDSPADPADDPPLQTFPASTHARAVLLPDPFGGDDDFAVDLALPWADLEAAGLSPTTPIRVWAGTSSVSGRLDSDIACHDGASGDPRLSDTHSDPTIADDEADSDGDGYSDAEEVAGGSDPADPDSVPVVGDVRLEGGGGCAVSGRGTTAAAALALAVLALGARRRRRG